MSKVKNSDPCGSPSHVKLRIVKALLPIVNVGVLNDPVVGVRYPNAMPARPTVIVIGVVWSPVCMTGVPMAGLWLAVMDTAAASKSVQVAVLSAHMNPTGLLLLLFTAVAADRAWSVSSAVRTQVATGPAGGNGVIPSSRPPLELTIAVTS